MKRILLSLVALALIALGSAGANAQTDNGYFVGAISKNSAAALGEALVPTVNTAATGTVTVNMGQVNNASLLYFGSSAYDLTLTGATTIAVGNYLPSGTLGRVHLLIRQGGAGSYAITWPGAIKWSGGTAPTFPTAVGSVISIVLESDDGGATLIGLVGP